MGSGFRVQGSGFRVQGRGGGFAANIYEAMPEDLLRCCYARIASLPLEGEGAPKGRIGHRRYEREWGNAFQAGDLREYPSTASAAPLSPCG